MVFSSLVFLYFYLPIVMIIYLFLGNRGRNILLLVSGLFFYAWGEPFYIIIMLISTLIDYNAGLIMDKNKDDPKIRKRCLIVSVCMNLGLLAIFKYSDFIFNNINAVFGADITNPVLLVNRGLNKIFKLGLTEDYVRLPIGISFFTFQSMSYTIDLYRRNIKVQKSFVRFAAYVSMFPQIVAGPIVRYDEVAADLDSRTVNMSKIGAGTGIFIKGLAKKVLLANNIGSVWTAVKAMDFTQISALTAWLGILAFTFQIYFDFSGYSDMAVGLGKMLGFRFPKNFDHPYMSKSVSEFWRKWHMTLGSWFRSYVYIPLGGNRKGKLRTYLNLLIVWSLTGMWHGASWNFILWGFFYGVLIVIEKADSKKLLDKIPSFLRIFFTFMLTVFGWVLFDTDTLADAGHLIGAMFGANGTGADGYGLYTLSSNIIIFLICIFGSTDVPSKLTQRLNEKAKGVLDYAMPVVNAAALLVCTAFLADATYNPFMYFRF